MSDFSDRPLVAGTIIGLRAFDVDKLGRLVGPSYAQVFTPAENVAECRKYERMSGIFGGGVLPSHFTYTLTDPFATSTSASGASRWRTSNRTATTPDPKPEPEPEVKHTAGIKDCACGFYAYFNGRNDYKEPSRVTAIIEGYGVVTMGTEGFRAEKARLAAVVEPGKRFPDRIRGLLHRNYSEVPFYSSKTEALETHPISVERVPSPADENFWTRSAAPR